MSDEQLLDYKGTMPYPIYRLIEVEDDAILSDAVDCFRMAMDSYVDAKLDNLKRKERVNGGGEKQQNNEDPLFIDVGGGERLVNEVLEESNRKLLEAKMEVSKSFGVYFMNLFQIAMDASKKYVLFNQMKRLILSPPQRQAFVKPYKDKVVEMMASGNITASQQNVKLNGLSIQGVYCGLTATSSVRLMKGGNCSICNHKIDPQYLLNLYDWDEHQTKTRGGDAFAKEDDEIDEENENGFATEDKGFSGSHCRRGGRVNATEEDSYCLNTIRTSRVVDRLEN